MAGENDILAVKLVSKNRYAEILLHDQKRIFLLYINQCYNKKSLMY
ncbi:hypothetical protein Xmir_01315 [Xenorhabdus miraniensis]|uniref:Uncharacterized protein n=1 Tax=Xenorhabdus miraniensis TaxID=351674 RepID=A0A2D0JSU8_9GAMM|nr:hypothetical protein Xmir_01315 [Xenorhabdus miraniensis]